MAGRYTLANAYHNWPHWQAKVLGRKAPSPRARVVAHALWAVKHTREWPYTEDTTTRSEFLSKPRGAVPIPTDCSGFVTWCYWMGGAPDPNGLYYMRLGFTGTIAAHAHTVTTNLRAAKPGDLIVVGLAVEGGINVGVHVYTVVKAGANPLCASHGSPGVELVRVLSDGRKPYRVCVSL